MRFHCFSKCKSFSVWHGMRKKRYNDKDWSLQMLTKCLCKYSLATLGMHMHCMHHGIVSVLFKMTYQCDLSSMNKICMSSALSAGASYWKHGWTNHAEIGCMRTGTGMFCNSMPVHGSERDVIATCTCDARNLHRSYPNAMWETMWKLLCHCLHWKHALHYCIHMWTNDANLSVLVACCLCPTSSSHKWLIIFIIRQWSLCNYQRMRVLGESEGDWAIQHRFCTSRAILSTSQLPNQLFTYADGVLQHPKFNKVKSTWHIIKFYMTGLHLRIKL